MATLFGLATSLGLGVQQINAGLDYLFFIGQGSMQQILLIAGITLMATVSVVLGLDRGIRRLSQFNIFAALALLLFVFVAGPSLHLLDALVQNIGVYLSTLPKLDEKQLCLPGFDIGGGNPDFAQRPALTRPESASSCWEQG